MQVLTSVFGGMNNRFEPHLIPLNVAREIANVNLESGAIRPERAPQLVAGAPTLGQDIQSMYRFQGTWIIDTTPWVYAEYGGMLYRAAPGEDAQKSEDGTTWYDLGVPIPTKPTVSSLGPGTQTGEYTWWASYVSIFGEESPLSEASDPLTLNGETPQVSMGAVNDPVIAAIRFYRLGGAINSPDGTPMLVEEVANPGGAAINYADVVPDHQIGEASTNKLWEPPPTQPDGIAISGNGVAVAWRGSTLYVNAAPGIVHAYTDPPVIMGESVTGAAEHPGGLLILTRGAPYTLTGLPPFGHRMTSTESEQGGIGPKSVADIDGGVVYASQDGLVAFSGLGSKILTEEFIDSGYYKGLLASQLNLARLGRGCVLFHDDGYLEYDPRISPPWKAGTVAANASFFDRTENELYIAQGGEIYKWSAGAPMNWVYHTGNWAGKPLATFREFIRSAVVHTGEVTVTPYVDEEQAGDPEVLTVDTLKKSTFWMPLGSLGERLSFRLEGTGAAPGSVSELLSEFENLGTFMEFPQGDPIAVGPEPDWSITVEANP